MATPSRSVVSIGRGHTFPLGQSEQSSSGNHYRPGRSPQAIPRGGFGRAWGCPHPSRCYDRAHQHCRRWSGSTGGRERFGILATRWSMWRDRAFLTLSAQRSNCSVMDETSTARQPRYFFSAPCANRRAIRLQRVCRHPRHSAPTPSSNECGSWPSVIRTSPDRRRRPHQYVARRSAPYRGVSPLPSQRQIGIWRGGYHWYSRWPRGYSRGARRAPA